jgi:hypothetical protein
VLVNFATSQFLNESTASATRDGHDLACAKCLGNKFALDQRHKFHCAASIIAHRPMVHVCSSSTFLQIRPVSQRSQNSILVARRRAAIDKRNHQSITFGMNRAMCNNIRPRVCQAHTSERSGSLCRSCRTPIRLLRRVTPIPTISVIVHS